MDQQTRAALGAWAAAALIAGCGGGGDPGPTPPTLADRTAAASSTALNNAKCLAIQPFHWSIGDASGRLAEGSVGTSAPTAQAVMLIASASKLLYGAWVAEQRGGVLSAEDVRFLTFTSGYTEFDACLPGQTVAECQSYQGVLIKNGSYVAANDGKFFYSGGHMQKHATLNGLGPDDNAALALHIMTGLANVPALGYVEPQLAGGVQTSAGEYGRFLQRTLAGQTKIAALLGSHAVCTNPRTCATAVSTPVPTNESWHYSIGHWVEDDPLVGDGAFSSPGAFGFYPWISADKQWWGIVARHDNTGTGDPDPAQRPGVQSVYCGREIRAAWLSAKAR
ncbi:MAG TPA: hypothetical protein VJ608_03690 [Albitalea sp.]|nr:hypothetical protein [Albitalea sp.]